MKKLILLAASLFTAFTHVFSQNLQLVPFASGFSLPTVFTHAGDNSGAVYITEKAGYIKKISGGATTSFMDIHTKVYSTDNETGLLGLAFHPEFEDNGFFYVNYTIKPSNQLKTRISRFEINQNGTGNSTSEKILLEFNQPYANHNGGTLLFGMDGYLYIATGDGGSSGDPQNNAQNTQSFLGKILRLDVDSGDPYGIPSDNPYASNTAAGKPEIYAYGLRNPWKMTMDKNTGEIYIGDVGQNTREEIDVLVKGGNYGWKIMEGVNCYNATSCTKTGLILPIYDYARASGCSVTGGYVYRGTQISSLSGKYIFGDYCTGTIWTLTLSGASITRDQLFETDYSISSFGEDEAGEVYVMDYSLGSIYKIKDITTSVLSEKENVSLLTIVPNPSNGNFSIEIPQGVTDFQVELLDMHGKFLKALHPERVNKSNAYFSAPSLVPGVYTVKVLASDKRQFAQRLIIHE